MKQRQHELQQAKDDAERATQVKSEFLEIGRAHV